MDPANVESELPPPSASARPATRASVSPERRRSAAGVFALGLAFGAFGFSLGELSGFSVMQGISQIVLSSTVTFVGGVLLSYAGLRRVSHGQKRRVLPDPLRVGVALGCLSLGLCTGVPVGVYLRCNKQVQAWFLGESSVSISSCAAAEVTPALSTGVASLTPRAEPAPAATGEATAAPSPVAAADTGPPPRARRDQIGLQGRSSEACDRAFHDFYLALHASPLDVALVSQRGSELRAPCGLSQ